MSIVNDAMGTVRQIEPPNCTWFFTPWKVAQQNSLSDAIDKHLTDLDKFTAQLQSAISVASYAVSVEQLENVLNASSMLGCPYMKSFWQKRVGIQNTHVPVREFAESFLDSQYDALRASRKERSILLEKIAKKKDFPEIALMRFFGR